MLESSMNTPPGIWENREFRSYLGSTAFTGIAFSMQQLLLSWVLIGILELPANEVGIIQAITGIPGIFLMLLGGASADRQDPRSLLIQVYALAPVLPTFLACAVWFDFLNIWSVLLWSLGLNTVTSYSSPAQQAILNRVAGKQVQRAITASTSIGFMVQMFGLGFAGQMDKVGLEVVLIVQAVCLGIGALTIRLIRPAAVTSVDQAEPMWKVVLAGFKAVYDHKVILQTLIINFVSSIFNAGAFMIVFPFIIKRVYEGDALLLATMMIVFFGGAMVSNLIMLKLMPITRPGKFYLIMQLTRIIILGLLWIKPDFWLLVIAIIAWGLNMGVTTTLARTIVQESAAPEYRARILSVFSLGLLGSGPIGALVLGWIIEAFGTLNALIPAMAISVGLFLYGILATGIYQYESPQSD
jgi:predicted MFS family arabinose efflux permease